MCGAGNFTWKRTRAVIWLAVVVLVFVIVRAVHIARLNRSADTPPVQQIPETL